VTKNSSCNKLWRAVDEAAQPARIGMMRMICPVVAVGVLSWGSLQIYQMNAQVWLCHATSKKTTRWSSRYCTS